jgi:DNA helicase-2/ATP-dependent DNA helicase PcrA
LVNHIRYHQYLKDTEGEEKAQERMENIWQLINLASNFTKKWEEGLIEFLNEVSLLSEMENQWEEGWDFVKLMTIHASKWLEFPVVFIVGLEENVFPLSRAKLDQKELEEERRLMYVAITRAQKHLFLSMAKSRQKWWNLQYNPPSRFLEELEKEVPHLLKYYDATATSFSKPASQNLEEGDIVRHKIFGKWKILEIWWDVAIVKFFNPSFGNRKIDIRFLEKIE